MARGSQFWSTARGKLGDIVLSVNKGQQVARKYQPQVKNPKSQKQMFNRGRFAEVVKFYKHSQQNLFQFAYEDQLTKESYYNAFVRHNMQLAYPVNKGSSALAAAPAFGCCNACLSYGSLPQISDIQFLKVGSSSTPYFGFGCSVVVGSPENLYSDFSKTIEANYDLLDGDILTFVLISTFFPNTDAAIKSGFVLNDGVLQDWISDGYRVQWKIKQFRLDSSSEQTTSSMGAAFLNNEQLATSDDLTLDADPDLRVYLGAVIASRPATSAGGKLLVSTSYLQPSGDIAKVLSAEANEKIIVNSWGASEGALLEGSQL